MTQPLEKYRNDFDSQQLEIAQDELRVALMFADYSSAAFSRGKLQHAIDARSKARSLSARVAARLTAVHQQLTAL
jgi:hypothetical protein